MKYLGIIFNNNGTFNSATENLKDKSSKALFKLFKSFGSETPSIKTATHLFDAMIKPILLYNSEIWGNTIADYNKLLEEGSNKTKMYFQNTFEKMHVKWCKYLLGVHSKSTNIAVLAELGRYPLILEVILNQIKLWIRMTGCNANSLLYDCYKTNERPNGVTMPFVDIRRGQSVHRGGLTCTGKRALIRMRRKYLDSHTRCNCHLPTGH